MLLNTGDPVENRTRVTAVKGRCLNRLTTGPDKTGNVLLSQAASHQVSSALWSLTTVFEMGTGVTSMLLSPDVVKTDIAYFGLPSPLLREQHRFFLSPKKLRFSGTPLLVSTRVVPFSAYARTKYQMIFSFKCTLRVP